MKKIVFVIFFVVFSLQVCFAEEFLQKNEIYAQFFTNTLAHLEYVKKDKLGIKESITNKKIDKKYLKVVRGKLKKQIQQYSKTLTFNKLSKEIKAECVELTKEWIKKLRYRNFYNKKSKPKEVNLDILLPLDNFRTIKSELSRLLINNLHLLTSETTERIRKQIETLRFE